MSHSSLIIVIQYGGGSSNGGGKYWGVASWYVTLNDGALWSTELKLQPGQVVRGLSVVCCVSDKVWDIENYTRCNWH